jgi:hypothetical protein
MMIMKIFFLKKEKMFLFFLSLPIWPQQNQNSMAEKDLYTLPLIMSGLRKI